MADRATKTPAFQPGKYTACLAKFLEDEARAEEDSRYHVAMECHIQTILSTQWSIKAHYLTGKSNFEVATAARLYANPIVHHADYTSLENVQTTGSEYFPDYVTPTFNYNQPWSDLQEK
jgi:hypothetical protein